MKTLILIIILMTVIHAERLAVVGVISGNTKFSSAFMTALQTHLADRFTIVERDRMETVLNQQGLRLTGLMDENEKIPHIEDVDKIVTGIITSVSDSIHFVALKLIDVNFGITLKSDYYAVKGTFADVINSSPYAIDRLFKTTTHSRVKPMIVEKEIYVQPKQDVKKEFVPCAFCQGTGTLHNGNDCPYCDKYYHYTGIETNYKSLTGNWK